jgi:hypothetical protein
MVFFDKINTWFKNYKINKKWIERLTPNQIKSNLYLRFRFLLQHSEVHCQEIRVLISIEVA